MFRFSALYKMAFSGGLEPVCRGGVILPYPYALGPAEVSEITKEATQYVSIQRQNVFACTPDKPCILPIQQRLRASAASVITANKKVLALTAAGSTLSAIVQVRSLCG